MAYNATFQNSLEEQRGFKEVRRRCALAVHVNFSFHFLLYIFHYKKFSKDSRLVESESWDKTLPQTNQTQTYTRIRDRS
jgi:hypothetical protein